MNHCGTQLHDINFVAKQGFGTLGIPGSDPKSLFFYNVAAIYHKFCTRCCCCFEGNSIKLLAVEIKDKLYCDVK